VRQFRAAVLATDNPRTPEHGHIGRIIRDVHRLRGKNLAYWCKLGEPCHTDVLLEIANRL